MGLMWTSVAGSVPDLPGTLTAMPFESFQTIASHNVDLHFMTASVGHKILNPNYSLFLHHASGYALLMIGILTLLARIIYDGSCEI